MDGLTFVSNLIRDLAWPLVAVAILIAILLRGPSLVRFVKAFKFRDFEITMREEFIEAGAEAEKVKVETGHPEVTEINPKDKIIQLAEIDPALAIVDIWKRLDAQIVKLKLHQGNALLAYATHNTFLRQLQKRGKLSESEVNLYQRLRHIRNASVHDHGSTDLTLAQVIEYRDFVDVLAAKFEKMMGEPT